MFDTFCFMNFNKSTGRLRRIAISRIHSGENSLPSGSAKIGSPVFAMGIFPWKIKKVFWDFQGIIHWELLPSNTTVSAALYCEQLDRLRKALLKNRSSWVQERGKVRLLVDSARPHTAKATREKLSKLRWEVVAHPPYSPDLAPSDYALFRSLSNQLREKRFDDRAHLEELIETFFDQKSPAFYRDAIMDLPRRWETVIDNDGAYLID